MKSFRNYVIEKLRLRPKLKPKKSTFKGVEPDSKGWKQGKVAIGIGTHTSDGTTINLQKGKTLHYHAHGDKYIGSTNPKDPGTYFRMDKNRVNESTKNPEYDPELADMNIGEAKSKDIVKGLTDMDGPFTVVAIRNKKVIKQETTKMRNMLPAIVKTMRKDIGPGGTIAIEDKKGTIRGTFKEEVEEVTEKFEMEFADKETAQKFMSQIVRLRLGSATGTKDGKVTVHGPQQAGVGSPTRAHQQMSKIMKKFGGKIISTDEGPRMKKVFESPKVKIKLDPKKKIGYEIKSVGPGGKTTVTKRRDMPGKKDVGESKRVYGPGPDPRIKKLSKESKAELAIMANSFGHSGGPHLDANNVTGITKKAVDLCIRDAEKAIKNMGPKIPAKFKKMRVDNLAKLKKELGTK
tara:strand:+ start:8758 stop:9972 length:1215 start_codon:yes stop_codon:yes gene_type:complete